MPAPGVPDEASARSPPPTAAATNNMATNNRPLPRNTVAKKRSSRSPIRSRSTPTNHRNAIPANGTRFSATTTAVRRAESDSHSPATLGSAGTESRSSTSAVISSTEKRIPATEAARGVRSGLPAGSGSPALSPSATGPPSLGDVRLGDAPGYPVPAPSGSRPSVLPATGSGAGRAGPRR